MLPACGSPDKIDIGDIVADLVDPDVQTALDASTQPTFGAPFPDKGVFQVQDDRSRGFIINPAECGSGAPGPCVDTPKGVARLEGDLSQLEQDGLNALACRLP